MHKIVLSLFYCILLSCSALCLKGQNNFRAGAAMVDITPHLGTNINGGFESLYALKIHDPLHAKAVVLEKNKVTVAIVIIDVCYFENPFANETKKLIQKETGIPEANILIAATHNHSSGALEQWCLAPADMTFRQRLPSLILKSIQEAKKRARPAMIAFGSADVPEHVVCRRYIMKDGYLAKNPVTGGYDKVKTNPGGAPPDQIVGPDNRTDPEFSYMAVKGIDGKWISLLGNYSMHYVGDVEANTISADYFGEFSRQMKEKLNAPDEFVGMLSNGTSGDANIWDFMHPNRYPTENYAKSKVIANDLSNKVINSLNDVKWEKSPSLDVRYTKLPVAIRKPSAEEVKNAEKVISETDYVNLPGKPYNDDKMHRLYMLEQVVVYNMPDSISVAIQALKIGNNVIGGLGGEIFSATGLFLKDKSPIKSYFTISNANGYVGYIPTPEDLDQGGYETWRCRSSLLERNGEDIIKQKLLSMIKTFR